MAVASGGQLSVAIDTELSTALLVEGMAREIVKVVQSLRREQGLDVSDRIVLGWHAIGTAADAMSAFADWIAAETLATELTELSEAGDDQSFELGAGAAISLRVTAA